MKQHLRSNDIKDYINLIASTLLKNHKFKNKTLNILILKLLSNAEAIFSLISTKHYHEARIITRSLIESTIAYLYLMHNPHMIKNYVLESALLRFKNAFIDYKYLIDMSDEELEIIIDNKFPNIDDYLKWNKIRFIQSFFSLSKVNQKRILNYLGLEIFDMNETIQKRMDDFFLGRESKINKDQFQPFFLNIERMFREIPDDNTFLDLPIKIRKMFYEAYNSYSQIAHGSFNKWEKISDNPKDIYQILNNSFIQIFYVTLIKGKLCKIPEEDCQNINQLMHNTFDFIKKLKKDPNEYIV